MVFNGCLVVPSGEFLVEVLGSEPSPVDLALQGQHVLLQLPRLPPQLLQFRLRPRHAQPVRSAPLPILLLSPNKAAVLKLLKAREPPTTLSCRSSTTIASAETQAGDCAGIQTILAYKRNQTFMRAKLEIRSIPDKH